MAQAARPLQHSSVNDDDPLVSVHLSELDLDGTFEHGPWCVDDGQSIVCMTSMQIWRALDEGTLSSGLKVWRDGRACWTPLEEVEELIRDKPVPTSRQKLRQSLPKPPPVKVVPIDEPPPTRFPDEGCFAEPEEPDQSGVRRIRDRNQRPERAAKKKLAKKKAAKGKAAEDRAAKRRASRQRGSAPKALSSTRDEQVRLQPRAFARPALSPVLARVVLAVVVMATLAGGAMLLSSLWAPKPGAVKRVAVDVGQRCLEVAAQTKRRARATHPSAAVRR